MPVDEWILYLGKVYAVCPAFNLVKLGFTETHAKYKYNSAFDDTAFSYSYSKYKLY
jgi:hypothetical protein